MPALGRFRSPHNDHEWFGRMVAGGFATHNVITRHVAEAFDVPIMKMLQRNIQQSKAAEARQTAMYLVNTCMGVNYIDIGLLFDVTSVAARNACQNVEDRRDDQKFDALIMKLEARLTKTAAGSWRRSRYAYAQAHQEAKLRPTAPAGTELTKAVQSDAGRVFETVRRQGRHRSHRRGHRGGQQALPAPRESGYGAAGENCGRQGAVIAG